VSSTEQSVAERARRGVAIITFAKAWFLLTGFAQPVLLTRALGKANYGVYGAVLAAVSILNNVVVAGSIQAMSKSVTNYGTPAIRRGLALHAALGVATSVAFAALAGPIGEQLLNDPGLPPLLRIASIVTGMYCVYAALVGSLNGAQRFVAQAALDIVFATLRTALIVGLAWVGLGVKGAVGGFAAASVVITFVALAVVAPTMRRRAEPANAEPSIEAPAGSAFAKEYAGFFAPVLLYQLALNIVLQADVLVMQAVLTRTAGATLEAVKELIGVYKSVQSFAFLPYQLLIAVTFVLFPVVSKAAAEGDVETTRTMLRGALRFALLLLGAMLAVIAGVPEAVLRVVYRPEFYVGASALRWLALGQGAFALAVIGLTVILASKRVAAATWLMLTMLALVFVGDLAALSIAGFGERALSAAAIGTASGTTLGALVVFGYILRLYGSVLPWKTGLRSTAAALLGALAGSMVRLDSKLSAVAACAVAASVFVVALLLLGEVTASERAKLVRRFKR
jgi:stage V sporulation protein B